MASEELILPGWKYLTSFHRGLLSTSQYCPPRPYLSLRVPDEEESPGSRVTIKRAVFTTISHDQGYASEAPEFNGTYEDSNTWFEVSVTDRLGQDRVLPEPFTRNRRAEQDFFEHVVCWDFRDNKYWFRNEDDVLPYHASGLVAAQWISAIRAGDTVSIVPQALFPGWVNFIVEARIELWIDAVQVVPSLRPRLTENLRTYYKPLEEESTEIRVVAIEPAAGNSEQPIRLHIQHIKLGFPNHLQYEALSYCWGSSQDTRAVLLMSDDGERSFQAPISANLACALKQIRLSDRPRVLWIDQLCINQNDVNERSQQIALMANIYASASSVCVWLGEVEEIIHTSLDIDKIESIAKRCGGSSGWKDAHAAIKDEAQLNFQWHNDRLFLRPWFQRIWVLQEVWNASNSGNSHKVTVLCGKHRIPWWVIMQANACLFHGHRIRKNNTMPRLWLQLFKVPRNLSEACVVLPSSRLDILTTVIQGLDFKASDARDRIFALLSFGLETYRVSELPTLIRPDYNKSAVQVYCDFSLWWIKKYQSLRILSAVHTLRKRTWVDLSGDHTLRSDDDWLESFDQPTWTLWSNGDSTWARATLALNEPVTYSACGHHTLDTALLETSQAFDLGGISQRFIPAFKGVRISSIKSIEPFKLSYLESPGMRKMAKAYMHVFDPTAQQGTWRGTSSFLNDPEEDISDEIVSQSMNHQYEHARDGMYSQDSLPCLGRCVQRTSDGRLGLCPSGARVGDLIVILYGGLVPYLLRAKETHGFFSFIGECYLDGIMHGETFQSECTPREEHIFRLI
jgi:hypothetical protein